ncbi:MAG: hypothetical protein GVY07_14815 [Bacteroidetes bacterium]|jgi:hypothetical protein|nr:hypothetical protein [Bacteroidota bacterium]
MRAFIAILFFSWFLTLFLPWWGIVIPGLIFGAWLLEGGFRAFITGFFACGFAWFFQALYIDIANESILSSRIAEMMGIGSHWIILFATFLIAALVGGLATLAGTLFKQVFRPAKRINAS